MVAPAQNILDTPSYAASHKKGKVLKMFTLTSEVSRWQFFQDKAIEEKSRFG
jgi:hypothetical protein